MSLLGGTPVLAPFPSFVVALKKKSFWINEEPAVQSRSSDCGFSFLFDPSVSVRKCRFRLWSFPQIENCAPLPVANTAQRKRLGNRKSEEGISFSPSPVVCLFIWPVYKSIQTLLSAASRTGLGDTRRITTSLKGVWAWGGHSTEIAINLRQRVNTPASWWHTSCCMWAVSHRGCS